MKRFLLACTTITAVILTAGCKHESKCHVSRSSDIYGIGNTMVDSSTGIYNSFLDGRMRVFVWSKVIDKMCTAEPVKVNTELLLTSWQPDTALQVYSYVSWNYTRKQDIQLTKGEDSRISGKVEVNLVLPIP